MEKLFCDKIATELNLGFHQVQRTLNLISDGATIPFISRYRKEQTDGLNEVQIEEVKKLFDKYVELDKRKKTILKSAEEQGVLTNDLHKRILECFDSNILEDIYLPFKPKRKTKAEKARQNGLEPLASYILLQKDNEVRTKAKTFVKGEVKNVDEAISGACDIIAEHVSENERSRQQVRNAFEREAIISSKLVKGKEEEGQKYRDYFDFSEPLKRCSSHRLLALRRGEAEGILHVSISPNDEMCIERLNRLYVHGRGECSTLVAEAVTDGYKRLLRPSIETEFNAASKNKADAEAIRVFVENLKQLLLAAPLGQKRVLAIDPGFRTGCKVVCLDAQGQLLHNETIFPHPPRNEYAQSQRKVQKLVEQYDVDAIAVGNGTAGRETERFVQSIRFTKEVRAYIVSEDGASVYSASTIAREEFPDYDVTVRGAVSIGRRLMDPLAELVKIDPKSIGVGQYQHDVNQTELKRSLDRTVEHCVNSVGVNLNTASRHLLTYISGLGPQLAKNIVEYRNENGAFSSRKQLMKVPRMGAKAYEQCVGFLRVPNAKNPLDNTAVHPESYSVVEQMAKDMKCSVAEFVANKELRNNINLERYVTAQCGMPTLQDIMFELDKPGRDPRAAIKVFAFSPDVSTIDDLKEGMVLPGIVSNITNFGCFVDVGVHEKGLVHISQLADRYVSDPNEVVSLHQQVMVRVLEVDRQRKRISLSLIIK